jgi:hypothetical protein
VCACTVVEGTKVRGGACPVHALIDLLAARKSLGLGPKHSLMCSVTGQCVSAALTIASLRRVTGDKKATEHSMRRAGAQHYARMGVMLYIIQFLGRWGSAAVERYVGNAFVDIAAAASLGGGTPLLHSLANCRKAVGSASSGSSGGGGDVGATADKFDAWWKMASSKLSEQAATWQKSWQAAQDRAHGGVCRAGGRGRVHRVIIGDPIFPLKAWATKCGWHFGTSTHMRVSSDDISCLRCLVSDG